MLDATFISEKDFLTLSDAPRLWNIQGDLKHTFPLQTQVCVYVLP